MLGKALLIFLVLAFLESVNGIFRVRVLNRRLGSRRAKRFSLLTGAALVLLVAWFFASLTPLFHSPVFSGSVRPVRPRGVS